MMHAVKAHTTIFVGKSTPESVLIFWVTPFVLVVQRTDGVNILSISHRQSAIRRQKLFDRNHVNGTGHYVAINDWKTWPECLIQPSEVGLTIMDATTNQFFTRSLSVLNVVWSSGRHEIQTLTESSKASSTMAESHSEKAAIPVCFLEITVCNDWTTGAG